MKKHYRKAFYSLRKIGVPVIEGGYSGRDTFRISAESNTDEKRWADYHEQAIGLFGVCKEITNILDEHKLFAEWINPGVLEVHDA
jgi:hypothetical protein